MKVLSEGVWLELGHTADSLVRATLQDSDSNFESQSELTLEATKVTHIQFLPTITLNNNTVWSNRQVMRINEMITKDGMLWCSNKFSQAVSYGMYEEQYREDACWSWGLEGYTDD